MHHQEIQPTSGQAILTDNGVCVQDGKSASGEQQAKHYPPRTRQASDSQQVRMLQLSIFAG